MRIIICFLLTIFIAGNANAIAARKEAQERQKERELAELQRDIDKVKYLKRISEFQSIDPNLLAMIINNQQEQNKILTQILLELQQLNLQ